MMERTRLLRHLPLLRVNLQRVAAADRQCVHAPGQDNQATRRVGQRRRRGGRRRRRSGRVACGKRAAELLSAAQGRLELENNQFAGGLLTPTDHSRTEAWAATHVKRAYSAAVFRRHRQRKGGVQQNSAAASTRRCTQRPDANRSIAVRAEQVAHLLVCTVTSSRRAVGRKHRSTRHDG